MSLFNKALILFYSGEIAFKAMSTAFAWAVNPMIMRATALPSDIPVTMLYGARSWMDIDMGMEMKYRRRESEVNVHVSITAILIDHEMV